MDNSNTGTVNNDSTADTIKDINTQLEEALNNQKVITEKLKKAITEAEENPIAGLPEEYKQGFINCGNVLAFEKNLYTVERENGEIVVKNIYQELVDKSAEAAAKASREGQALPNTGTRKGGRRTRKQKKLSKKSLKKMSKKELLKMVKSMKKK